MIDTVVISFNVAMKASRLGSWMHFKTTTPNGEVSDKYTQRGSIDSAPAEFTYTPPNHRYPLHRFQVQVSLPKVLFGDNVQMIMTEEEIGQAISKVNEFFAEKAWLPDLDLGKGSLYRVDACYNHPVGDRVLDYIAALSRLTYPGRKTGPYLNEDGVNEGVQFRSRSRRNSLCSSFYDKYLESHRPSAYGLLRQEASIRHAFYIERRMRLETPTLRDVKISWLRETLQQDLERLSVDRNMICNRRSACDMLVKKHGPNTGFKLLGYLFAMQSMDRKQLVEYHVVNERTMRRWNKEIAEAGVVPALVDSQVELAPLSIDVWTVKNDLNL